MSPEIIDLLYNVAGFLGSACVIAMYFANVTGRINSQGLIYPIVNLLGAILLIISLYRFFNLGSFIIEIFWAVISFVGLWKYYRRKTGKIKPQLDIEV